jgi:predicted TIM-barrel fold metal-dependent hydrolase
MPVDIELTARDRDVFETELKPWLPARIFDAHVHIFSRDCFPATYRFAPKSCYRRFGEAFRIEQCLAAARTALPGVEYGLLGFGTPDREADRENMAAYAGAAADNDTVFGLAVVAPTDAVTVLEQRIRQHRLVGYKPYDRLVPVSARETVGIPDMLPAPQMELADALGLAVTLHLPRPGRLADPANQREVVALAGRYPRAKIILAHIGRAYCRQNVIGHLDAIAACPNVFVDLAMVNHEGVLEYAFRHFPTQRILFGSDAPIAWLRGKSVEINNQYAYLMGEDYRIGTAIYDADKAVEFTFFYYEMLRGIKLAADRAGLSRAAIEGIFHRNALTLLRDVASGLGYRGRAAV